MKNSAVKAMLCIQYAWDKDDFVVEFTEFYSGEWHYKVKHLDGTELSVTVRSLDCTPLQLEID